MSDFVFESDGIAVPKGAWAKTHRHRLRWRGQTVLALTQGDRRAYVYPLCTPAGFCVTAEAPADHPHHGSLWIASDHVHAMMPAANGAVEEYTYNFYVDETFQARAPGRILQDSAVGREKEGGRLEIVQALEWRGPAEWAAEAGRLIARETRTFMVPPGQRRHRIDGASRLAGGDFAIQLGPTRHAYFNVRGADSMIVANGGVIVDDRGRMGGSVVSGDGARWVDFTGPVGAGHFAGMTVIPHLTEGRQPFWFVADWGVVTVGQFRVLSLALEPGEIFESAYTVLVHDGELEKDDIEQAMRDTHVS
ncbi:MAG: PmoA family protein [Pseudomonadota bacterium]|nr:PmoA family protein [Pseudomonadota bacterium]